MSEINNAVIKEINVKTEAINKLKAKRENAINKLTAIQLELVTAEQNLSLLNNEFMERQSKDSISNLKSTCSNNYSRVDPCGPSRY